MNFRAELVRQDNGKAWVVAFGEGSWIAFDNLGLPRHQDSYKNRADRQFWFSGQTLAWKAATKARMLEAAPYGTKDSARRRKLCQRIAEIAGDLEAIS